MQPFFATHFANPSAIHTEGKLARQVIDDARQKVARILSIRESGVIWTASGTEANNLAIYGLLRHLIEEEGRSYKDIEIISTEIEHSSVIEVLKHIETLGVEIKYVKLHEDGQIDLKDLEAHLSTKTALITFSYVNSEIGVVQHVKQITRAVRLFNDKHQVSVKTHLDAAQGPLWLSCQLEQLGVDMLSLDAAKCYGPKGVGLLACRQGLKLKGLVLGGGQERGLRGGTENTPLIVGAAESIKIAQEGYAERSASVGKLRDYCIAELSKIDGVVLNGSVEDRVANNINVSIDGVESEFAAITLDTAGISCSTKSACGSGKSGGSQVIRAITGDDKRATTSLRFTLGEGSTKNEIDIMISVLKKHVEKTRSFAKKY